MKKLLFLSVFGFLACSPSTTNGSDDNEEDRGDGRVHLVTCAAPILRTLDSETCRLSAIPVSEAVYDVCSRYGLSYDATATDLKLCGKCKVEITVPRAMCSIVVSDKKLRVGK